MSRPFHARLALLSAACALAAGCAPRVISRSPEPAATVLQINAPLFARDRAELQVELEVDNPTAAFALTSAEYQVLVEGRPFASGTVRLDQPVPASGRTGFRLPVRLTYLDLPARARSKVTDGEPVTVATRGLLHGEQAGRPVAVEFSGESTVAPTSPSTPGGS